MARKLGIHSWQNEKNYSHQINYMYVVQLSKKILKKKKSCQNIYLLLESPHESLRGGIQYCLQKIFFQ